MLCDAHVHVGYFRGLYSSPEDVVRGLLRLGVSRWAISSTSTSGKSWAFVRREYERTRELASKQSVLLLWLTPKMLDQSRDLRKYDVLPFCGLKIHGANGWQTDGKPLRRAFAIAQERKWPVILHTGGSPEYEAGRFGPLCKEFPAVRVVLAHGRPLDQALEVMQQADNAWVDTAFMPLRDVQKLLAQGMNRRVLFGSDYSAPASFFKSPLASYYRRRVAALRGLGETAWRLMAERNFIAMFTK
ncbi:MAG: amidohydrolase family protein [Kiritimatiellaeota bacterium]|nr:amidohydrolase family protein [Kiritimatiellota bacterium]